MSFAHPTHNRYGLDPNSTSTLNRIGVGSLRSSERPLHPPPPPSLTLPSPSPFPSLPLPSPSPHLHPRPLPQVGFLRSYERMGAVRVDCVHDCACDALTIDAHLDEHISPLGV